MPASIECRRAREDELDAIARVWFESAREADGAPAHMPTVGDLRARIDTELAGGWSLSVALVHDRIAGLLALKPREAVLDQLFILPALQRRGIGEALLRRAMATMPGGFTLRTASANLGARSFYERMGLLLLREGRHPRDGHPVCFYGWKIG